MNKKLVVTIAESLFAKLPISYFVRDVDFNKVYDEQVAKGVVKYGHTLKDCPINKYDWETMMCEELIDAAQYYLMWMKSDEEMGNVHPFVILDDMLNDHDSDLLCLFISYPKNRDTATYKTEKNDFLINYNAELGTFDVLKGDVVINTFGLTEYLDLVTFLKLLK